MENKKMMRYRAPLALLLGSFAVFGCWQKLDEHASDGVIPVSVNANGGIGAKFPTMTDTPAIGETAADNGDPTTTASDGCAKDAFDTQKMLSFFCDGCHQVGGNGNLQGIDDMTSLINKPASNKYMGMKFIVPGDPGNSLIFKRVAAQEMPPPSSDVTAAVPHPTVSDTSVLEQWILCLGSAPAGGSTPPADGGTN